MREQHRSPVLRRLGENVRTARHAAGLSQEQLALKAGIDRTYVGGVERGERNIAAMNLVRLGRALGVPPGSLLDGL